MAFRILPALAAAVLVLAPLAITADPTQPLHTPAAPATSVPPGKPAAADAAKPNAIVVPATAGTIDLVICLDTSGSMDGLLDSARVTLWDIVNAIGAAEPTPKLRVALLTYGNDGHSSDNGWVNIDADFTNDLDRLYERLFALTTNGGQEYVARVVNTSIHNLAWSSDPNALRIVYVAGNEPATQDPKMSVGDVMGAAKAKGICVNAIYCGADGAEAGGWREAAHQGGGKFFTIDQNGVTAIETPYDAELAELSTKLNGTYIAYGAEGAAGAARQEEQDKNAGGVRLSLLASRAASKATANYTNATWDLVDAVKQNEVKVEDVPAAQLPELMQKMDVEERVAYVAKNAAERDAINAQIKAINTKREEFLKQQRTANAAANKSTLQTAILDSLVEQAATRQILIPKS